MTTRNLSLLLLWGCRLAIAGLLATMLIGAWVSFHNPEVLVLARGDVPILGDLSLWAWLGSVVVAAAVMTVAIYVLLQVHQLFDIYRAGDLLSAAAATRISRIGKGTLLLAIASVLAHPVLTVLLTSANPVGQRAVSLALSSNDASLLLLAGLLTVIGRALREAAAVAAENKAFV